MDKNNLKKNRYKKLIHRLRSAYSQGRLITEENWDDVQDLVSVLDRLETKSSYLKTNVLISNFLDMEIEEYQELIQGFSLLLKTLIDIEDLAINEDYSLILNKSNKAFLDLDSLRAKLDF